MSLYQPGLWYIRPQSLSLLTPCFLSGEQLLRLANSTRINLGGISGKQVRLHSKGNWVPFKFLEWAVIWSELSLEGHFLHSSNPCGHTQASLDPLRCRLQTESQWLASLAHILSDVFLSYSQKGFCVFYNISNNKCPGDTG